MILVGEDDRRLPLLIGVFTITGRIKGVRVLFRIDRGSGGAKKKKKMRRDYRDDDQDCLGQMSWPLKKKKKKRKKKGFGVSSQVE